MRVAPLGCSYKSIDVRIIDEEGAQLAAITHGHPLGYMPAAVLVHIVHRAVFNRADSTLKDIINEAIETVCECFLVPSHFIKLFISVKNIAHNHCHLNNEFPILIL